MTWENFSKFENRIFEPVDIEEMITLSMCNTEIIKTNKKIEYYNVPCSFDIETTSFFRSNVNKGSIMYEWTLGINGAVMIGRTWEEFIHVYHNLCNILDLNEDKRLIIYSHNLAFEFQYLKNWLSWKKVFSLNVRKPCYALTNDGVEFRCSYILSGYSLAKLGEQLITYKVNKMVGDLDYSLIRHSGTKLSDKEVGYCVNDVRVVMSYIQEKIEHDGNITKIPYTKTGYVRTNCRNACLYDGSHKNNTKKYTKYVELMQSLKLTPSEYLQLKRAFQGGFTHANAHYVNKILHNIKSYDFTSSYPYTMVVNMFPMSCGKIVNIKSKEEFEYYLHKYCCLFDIEFNALESSTFIEHPLSSSRCFKKHNVIEDNGRVVSAEHIYTTLTELDFDTISYFYEWESAKVYNFRIYKKGYLPTDLVKSILKMYGEKTMLKDVKGKETEYLRSKEMINSAYGMIVTDICRDDIIYDGEWKSSKSDIDKSLKKYNDNKRRFLFYPWGVWVTAYARHNLFSGIIEFGEDYVYSDTDSVKVKNYQNHVDYINKYNENVIRKLERACNYHGIDTEMTKPKTIEGEEKILGVWDDEGIYTRFKTLGAKRYMIEKDGKINITVSGLNKKIAVPYLINKYKDKVFENFTDDLYVPPGHTGKNTFTYIDDEIEGYITDYLGNESYYYEKSGAHLEPADYTLSLSKQFVDYLKGVRTYED